MRHDFDLILSFFGFLLVAVIVAGCGSARVSQFDKFADAGVRYADTIPLVLDRAFEAAVEADSASLQESRKNLGESDRLDVIEQSNANLDQRLEILSSLKEHSGSLRAYFVALKALAGSDAESGLGTASRELTENLGKLSKKISTLKVGSLPVKDFLGQAIPIIVTQFKSAALNRELKERAKVIKGELNLQQAALTAVAQAMRADYDVQFTILERDRIVLPYVRSGELPSDWNNRRHEAFTRRLQLTSVNAAVNAARNLRLSFVALVENRIDGAAISLLIQDVERVVNLMRDIKREKEKNT